MAAAVPASAAASTYLSNKCRLLRLGGQKKGGGWTFCEFPEHSVVFSIGIGGDASFDAAVVRRFNARVDSFDPALTRPTFEKLVEDFGLTPEQRGRLTFHPFGLAAADGIATLYRKLGQPAQAAQDEAAGSKLGQPAQATSVRTSAEIWAAEVWAHGEAAGASERFAAPVVRLPTLMAMASRARVDVLKLDIEGGEYELFDAGALSWLAHEQTAPSQISVLFHDQIVAQKGGDAKEATRRVVALLKSCGYAQRHVRAVGAVRHTYLMVRAGPPAARSTAPFLHRPACNLL